MSNLDPTHVIPLIAAGALQSGMAFCIMPTATGFAVILTQPNPMTDDEIESHSEASAIAVTDVMALDARSLAYQLGRATMELAGLIASEHAGKTAATEALSAEEQAMIDELGRTTPFPAENIQQAYLTTQETGAND